MLPRPSGTQPQARVAPDESVKRPYPKSVHPTHMALTGTCGRVILDHQVWGHFKNPKSSASGWLSCSLVCIWQMTSNSSLELPYFLFAGNYKVWNGQEMEAVKNLCTVNVQDRPILEAKWSCCIRHQAGTGALLSVYLFASTTPPAPPPYTLPYLEVPHSLEVLVWKKEEDREEKEMGRDGKCWAKIQKVWEEHIIG